MSVIFADRTTIEVNGKVLESQSVTVKTEPHLRQYPPRGGGVVNIEVAMEAQSFDHAAFRALMDEREERRVALIKRYFMWVGVHSKPTEFKADMIAAMEKLWARGYIVFKEKDE